MLMDSFSRSEAETVSLSQTYFAEQYRYATWAPHDGENAVELRVKIL